MYQEVVTIEERGVDAHADNKPLLGDAALHAVRARIASLRLPSHKFCAILAA